MTSLTLILIAINTGLAIFLAYLKRCQNSPFQFFYLSFAGLALFPSLFEKFGSHFDFHAFANPILMDVGNVAFAHLIIFLYLILFFALEVIFYRRIHIDFHANSYNYGIFYITIFALAGVILFALRTYGVQSFLYLSFSDLREGPLARVSLAIQYLLILSLPLPAFFLFCRNKRFLAAVLFILMALVSVSLGGSRQPLIFSVTILIAIYAQKRKNGFLWLILLVVLGFGFVDYILMFLKLIRNTNSIEDRFELIISAWRGEISLAGTSSEGTIRYVMYKVLFAGKVVNETPFSSLARSMLFWLPSFIDVFNIKPADFEYELFAHVMGNRVGTMHATYFGSTFADAGWGFPFWVLYTFIIMRVVELFSDSQYSAHSFIFWAIGVYMATMMARGSLYAPLVIFFVVLVLAMIEKAFKIIFTNTRI